MYVVSEFLDISAALGGEALSHITSPNPRRNYQGGITGAFDVTLPAGTAGEEIAVLLERVQGGSSGSVDGAAAEEAADLYLERRRLLRRWTPANDVFSVNVPLDAPRRIGTILAWKTSDEIEISGDLIATYPFSSGLSPRGTSDTTEGGDEILTPTGKEPILTVSMSFFSPEIEPPDPEEKFYKVMRALSPQRNFFFHGRNLSEAWIIGKSARRAVKYVTSGYGKRRIQPVAMVAL